MKYIRTTVYVKYGIDNWVAFKGIFTENRAREIRNYYKGWINYSGTILERIK